MRIIRTQKMQMKSPSPPRLRRVTSPTMSFGSRNSREYKRNALILKNSFKNMSPKQSRPQTKNVEKRMTIAAALKKDTFKRVLPKTPGVNMRRRWKSPTNTTTSPTKSTENDKETSA